MLVDGVQSQRQAMKVQFNSYLVLVARPLDSLWTQNVLCPPCSSSVLVWPFLHFGLHPVRRTAHHPSQNPCNPLLASYFPPRLTSFAFLFFSPRTKTMAKVLTRHEKREKIIRFSEASGGRVYSDEQGTKRGQNREVKERNKSTPELCLPVPLSSFPFGLTHDIRTTPPS